LNAAFIANRVSAFMGRGTLFFTPPPVYSPFHVQRAAVFEAMPVPRGAVLFFGDSLIENCEWSELLGVPAANRGISGEDTSALVAVVPALGDLHGVDSVFVAAGVNDVRVGFEGEAFAARYRALLNALHRAAPQAQITVQSLLPVNPGLDPVFRGLPAKIRAANQMLARLASEMGFRYLDVYRAFVDPSGLMDRRYTSDGLHPNGAGYQVWGKLLRPLVPSVGN
jgi:lysophospholipase L1-like esterase